MAGARQEQEQPEEAVREVAPGILRLQLPVSMPGLGHVNAYAMPDGAGVAIVDAGVPGEDSWTALEARLAGAGLRAAEVHTMVITHSHPDHFGGAHRLAEQVGAKVITHGAWQTRWHRAVGGAAGGGAGAGEDDCCFDLPDIDPADLPGAEPWTQPTPWGKESFVSAWLRDAPDARGWLPPEPDMVVADGDVLSLGGRAWRCVYTPGHTLDHLCLYDPDTGVLLSGDHVLPTITPHIPGIAGGRDPLAAYVASLDRVAALAGVGVVLPAHGQPFADLAGRVADIKEHHEARLDRLYEIVAAIGPSGVVAASHELFRQERWGAMAESETYAHLEHLRLSGRLVRRGTGAETAYTALPEPPPEAPCP